MKKKLLAALLACTMVAGVTACGSGSGSSSADTSSDAEAAQQTESSDSGEKVKLVYYGWTDEQSYLDPLFEEFNAQSTDAEIVGQYCAVDEYEEVVTSAMAAQTSIDVVAINGLGSMNNYQEKGYLMDMSEYADAAGFDPAEVYGDMYSGANADGMYGLPYRQAVWLMFYNKTMLDELGIEIQTDHSYTWEEYRTLCQEVEDGLKAEGKDIESDPNTGCYAGLVGMNKYVTPAQKGIRLDDEDTSAIEEFWTLWDNLQKDGTHLPYAEKLEYSTNVGSVYWVAGRVCFFQNATWGIANYNSKVASGEMPFEYGIMQYPIPEGVEDNTNLTQPNFFGIPVTSQHPEQAYEFIQWACTKEGAMKLAEQSVLPAYPDDEVSAKYAEMTEQKDDVLQRMITSKNNRLSDLCFENFTEVQSAYEEQMESFLCGNESLEDALNNFVTKRADILGTN